jgi:hypothetical protein
MKHQITIIIEGDDSLAARVYSRVSGAVEDMIESERPAGAINVSGVWSSGDEIDKLYVAKAQDEYATGSDDDVEIDDDAMVDPTEDGAWVYGRVFVRNNAVIDSAIDAFNRMDCSMPQRAPVLQVGGVLTDSEGGHCD